MLQIPIGREGLRGWLISGASWGNCSPFVLACLPWCGPHEPSRMGPPPIERGTPKPEEVDATYRVSPRYGSLHYYWTVSAYRAPPILFLLIIITATLFA
jgi:hypothetical protein